MDPSLGIPLSMNNPQSPHRRVTLVYFHAFLVYTPAGKQRSKSDKGDAKGLQDAKNSLICPIYKGLYINTSLNTSTMDGITTETDKYLKQLVQ